MLDAIVMDMDGTLLDPNNKILPETKEALIACQKQGTKRQFDSCKIVNTPNVAYVALFLCQIFFLFCCMDVVRRCNM